MNALNGRRAAMRAAAALAGPEVSPGPAEPDAPAGAGYTLRDDLPEPQEETIARLAKLPALDYERVREAEAARLRARPGVLDRLVKAARAEAAPSDGKPAQGRALSLPAPIPWHERVDGAQLLDRLAAFFTKHVYLPPGAADAMAAWTLHTHCYSTFRHSPRLAFTSPEKRCGKTTALDAVGLVVAKPLSTANVSTAAVFRTIEAAGPTLLIDEADTFLKDNEDLRGIMNAGHKRGGQVIRCVGDDAEPRAFAVYGPAAIAAIGRLPGTIEDRAILVRMARAKRAERPAPIRTAAETEGAELARRGARWCADQADKLRDADPPLPAGLFNRAADNWRPLFAIAVAAGGDWPARLGKAAGGLTPDDDDAEGRGVRLLSDVRTIFDREGRDKLASAELCEAISADPTSPWADYSHGKPIGQAQLARVLRPFGIVPSTVRIGAATAKGYDRASFAEAWSRYLPDGSDAAEREIPPGRGNQTVTPSQPAETAASTPYRPDTVTEHVPERKARSPANSATCDGVTVSNPQRGANDENPDSWRAEAPEADGWEADL